MYDLLRADGFHSNATGAKKVLASSLALAGDDGRECFPECLHVEDSKMGWSYYQHVNLIGYMLPEAISTGPLFYMKM